MTEILNPIELTLDPNYKKGFPNTANTCIFKFGVTRDNIDAPYKWTITDKNDHEHIKQFEK